MSDDKNEPASKWARSASRNAIERKFRFSSRSRAWGFISQAALVLLAGQFSVEWSDKRVKIILLWGEDDDADAALAIAREIDFLV